MTFLKRTWPANFLQMSLRNLNLLTIFLLFLNIPLSVDAQQYAFIGSEGKNIHLSYWMTNAELPDRQILDITEDSRGRVWLVGAKKGLMSLEGKKIKLHPKAKGGAGSKPIVRILSDARQNLWLFSKTDEGKLSVQIYDPFQEIIYSLLEYTGSSPEFSNRVAAHLFQTNGNIWLLDAKSGSGGYFSPDGVWHKTLNAAPMAGAEHISIYPAQENHFWVLNTQNFALDLINAEGQVSSHYQLPEGDTLTDHKVNPLGEIYLMSYIHVKTDHVLQVYKCDQQTGLTRVSKQEFYRSAGISFAKYDNYTLRKPNFIYNNAGIGISINEFNIYHKERLIYQDINSFLKTKGVIHLVDHAIVLPDGSFWLTSGNALIRLEVRDNYFTHHLKDQFPVPSTRGIGILGDRMYVNSYSGLYEVNLKSNQSRLISNEIGLGMSIVDNTLWCALHSQSVLLLNLATYNYTTQPVHFESGSLTDIYKSTYGSMYVGHSNFAFCKTSTDTEFQVLPNISGQVFHENTSGMWIGGSAGLWLFSHSNQPLKHFLEEITFKGKVPSAINDIYEDASGYFWMATNDGLWQWKPFSKTIKTYTTGSHNLPTNFLHAIHEDKNERLWIPSQEGLLCFDKRKETFHVYTVKDGLPTNEFNRFSHYQAPSGRLYLGSISGVVSFDPDSLGNQFLPDPKVYINALQLRSEGGPESVKFLSLEHILKDNPIKVPADVNEIIIHYDHTNFLSESVRYCWRIPEIDSSWRYINSPEISIFQLPFGDYTIEFGAFIPEFNTSAPFTMRLRIRVAPPFYFSAWFIILCIATLTGLVTLYFRWRHWQLRHLNKRLALEVAEKTEQLSQERDIIILKNKQLQELDEEKNRIFQYLSHEFRNPLTLIISPANDLLKQEALPAPFKPRLEQIGRNAKRILSLIDELLELSKLEAGAVLVNNSTVFPATLFRRIYQDFESMAAQKQISLKLTNAVPSDLSVLTDGPKLEKILVNLIQNALKHTPSEGTVHIKVQWIPQGILDIWISDTGIGIDAMQQQRIFERFYQVPGGNGQFNKGGFGIGLSLCKHYLDLLNGSISVFSKIGIGTDMHVTIPSPVTEVTHKQLVINNSIPNHKQKEILLVDDQEEMLDYIADTLAPFYRLTKASSGEEALRILETKVIDLIISDFMMDKMSGLELLSSIRQDRLLRDRPFILLTGLNFLQFEQDALALQADAILSKPFEHSELLDLVSQIIGKAHESNP